MRVYMAERYRQRRKEALLHLGGKCVKCESTEDLQFDHIDRKTKKFTIAHIWLHSKEKFWKEIEKCQLLCFSCHSKKTILESGKKIARGNHGTVSTVRYCKCELCKKAKREYMREYRRERRTRTIVA